MPAIYSNFHSGVTSDNPLTNSVTTVNSLSFSNLPTVAAPDYMWVVLDPDGVDGDPEVVKVTAHTSAASSVTVVRAQQGSAARQHAQGTEWRHTYTAEDGNGWLQTPDLEGTGGTLASSTVSYHKIGKMVFVWSNSAWNGTAFTMPVGFRPATSASAVLRLKADHFGAVDEVTEIKFATNGAVAATTGRSGTFSAVYLAP